MSCRKKYKYTALQGFREIRLLILHPGSGNDPIRVDLEHRTLTEDMPQFEALSYAWGDSSKKRTIICRDGQIDITQSLHGALIHLRWPEEYRRLLWADALCINQEDISERSSQVKLMGDIYRHAMQTTVWLGEETPDVAGACDAFTVAAETLWSEIESGNIPVRQGNFNVVQEYAMSSTRALENMVDWASIKHLLFRPWFRRRWIVQEITNAKQVLVAVGKNTVEWAHISTVALLCQVYSLHLLVSHFVLLDVEDKKDFEIIFNNIMFLARFTALPNHGLDELLFRLPGFACADPRDQLFALYGISEDASKLPAGLQPNYDPCVTIEELTDCYLHWQMDQHKSLRFFCNVPLQLDESSQRPSWRPKFDERPEYSSSLNHYRNFKASRELAPIHSILKGAEKTLCLAGRRVGEIERKTFPFKPVKMRPTTDFSSVHRMFKDMSKPIFEWVTACQNLVNIGGARLEGVQIKRIAAVVSWGHGLDLERRTFSDFVPLFTIFNSTTMPFMNWLLFCCPTDPTSVIIATFLILVCLTTTPLPVIEQHIHRFQTNRCIGITLEGNLLSLPSTAKVKDHIVILQGCNMPSVLRSMSGGRFLFIGLCYMEGFMDGEVLDLQGEKFEQRDYILI